MASSSWRRCFYFGFCFPTSPNQMSIVLSAICDAMETRGVLVLHGMPGGPRCIRHTRVKVISMKSSQASCGRRKQPCANRKRQMKWKHKHSLCGQGAIPASTFHCVELMPPRTILKFHGYTHIVWSDGMFVARATCFTLLAFHRNATV